jgi:hypothetical protein
LLLATSIGLEGAAAPIRLLLGLLGLLLLLLPPEEINVEKGVLWLGRLCRLSGPRKVEEVRNGSLGSRLSFGRCCGLRSKEIIEGEKKGGTEI